MPPEHHYNNQTSPYFRAPHIYIALSSRLMQGRQALSRERALEAGLQSGREVRGDPLDWLIADCSETVLMTTRGGTHFDRTFMEAFVRPGLGAENWVTRSNYALRGVVPTGEREMTIYVNRHNGQRSAHVQRHTLRTDGFVSVHAPYGGGELLTKPLVFGGGQDSNVSGTAARRSQPVLQINYSTSAAGSIRVELQDADGRPLPGFRLEDCQEIVGDEISRIVRWNRESDLSRHEGKPVRLRFVMKDADLYSIQFVP